MDEFDPPSLTFRVLKFGFLAAIVVFFLVFIYFASALFGLPDVRSMGFSGLKARAVKSVLKRLPEGYQHQWRGIDEISDDLELAVVFSEDAAFYRHKGVDWNGVWIAMKENIRKGRYARGGSTLTQQVVKNVFLTRKKTLRRKFKEYWISKDLEKSFKKKQILEVYLNVAEFGPKIFGVEEATAYYFKKDVEDVNIAEGIFLALMLPSPIQNHKYIFEEKNLSENRRKKIKRILVDMKKLKKITGEEFDYFLAYDFFNQFKSAEDPPEAFEELDESYYDYEVEESDDSSVDEVEDDSPDGNDDEEDAGAEEEAPLGEGDDDEDNDE